MSNEKSITSERWGYIDLLEALGIFFVVAYHSTTYEFPFLADDTPIRYLRYFSRAILSTCVPLFFFANGFLMLNRSFSLKKHIQKMKKLVILAIVWSIITLLVLMPIRQEYLSLKEFLLALWRLKQDWINHLWYLYILVGIYVFFPLLKTTYDHNRSAFVFFTAACAFFSFGNRALDYGISIAANITGLHSGLVEGNWFRMFDPFYGTKGYALAYYCIGGLAYSAIPRLMRFSSRKRNVIAVITLFLSSCALFVTGVLLSRITGNLWDIVFDGYDVVFTLINIIMLFVLSLSYQGHVPLIELISRNTLGIYLIHMILIHLTKAPVKTIPGAQTWVGSMIYSVVILFCSLGLTMVIHKVPLLNKLLSLK